MRLINVYQGEGRTPEYLSINPWGKVPTLVDGDFTLWESNAILQYLSEAHGDCRLWSREPRRRADISRWLFWEAAHWQPSVMALPGLAAFVGSLLLPRAVAPVAAGVDWSHEAFQSQARFLDAHLRGRAFLVGDEVSLADFSIAGMTMYLRPAGFGFEAFPQLGAWYGRMEGLDAWKATAAGPWSC